jgi:hypothetical protein
MFSSRYAASLRRRVYRRHRRDQSKLLRAVRPTFPAPFLGDIGINARPSLTGTPPFFYRAVGRVWLQT